MSEPLAITDNLITVCQKMSHGDHNVFRLLMMLAESNEGHEQQIGGFGPLLDLDRMGIRGQGILTLFASCGHSRVTLSAVLRGVLDNKLTEREVVAASKDIRTPPFVYATFGAKQPAGVKPSMVKKQKPVTLKGGLDR